jgi:putative transposase
MHISASDPALCNLAIFAQPHEKVSEGVCKVHLKLFKFDCMSLREAAARVYDTDLSDDAWALIEPMLPVPRFGGRPRTTNVRAVLNAILYLLRTGCQWRLLPREFPVWGTVYHYFRSWDNAGVWTYVQRTLYKMTRIQAGRSACPSVVIMDSQSVKTTERGGVRGSKRSRVNYYQDPINSILAPLARLTYSEAAPRMYPIFSLIAPIEIPG